MRARVQEKEEQLYNLKHFRERKLNLMNDVLPFHSQRSSIYSSLVKLFDDILTSCRDIWDRTNHCHETGLKFVLLVAI